jgi:hypothetical protein
MTSMNDAQGTRLQLEFGQTALFAYGSLLCRASMETTLGRAYLGPLIEVEMKGWRRSWDVAMPNQSFYYRNRDKVIYPRHILYLNILPVPSSLLNGIVFVVDETALQAMDAREWVYDRVPIKSLLEPTTIEGGEVFAYIAKPEYILADVRSPTIAAIRSTYLSLLEEGLTQRSAGFREKFELSTDPVLRHLIIEDLRQ